MSSANSSDSPSSPVRPGSARDYASERLVVRVENGTSAAAGQSRRWLVSLLLASMLLNAFLVLRDGVGYSEPAIPELHVSGIAGAAQRIAIINFTGTISPPFTERWLRQIKQAFEDQTVRGVVLAIDSPGGFVADSHQLYRELQKLTAKKPVWVAMKRMAASGGYYIAMGIGEQGRIYAEPTTWTGSIGVIVPRYNATELAKTIGVKVEPLVTGELKDTLNPFRDMTPREQEVWAAILKDSFDRFVGVISSNRRELEDAAVRALATGQIYTASQALENHLIDEIGYTEDAVTALAAELKLDDFECFEYRSTPGLIDVLLGSKASQPATPIEQLMESTIPRAMYYCSWNPFVGAGF